jgi:hypothetical protein
MQQKKQPGFKLSVDKMLKELWKNRKDIACQWHGWC